MFCLIIYGVFLRRCVGRVGKCVARLCVWGDARVNKDFGFGGEVSVYLCFRGFVLGGLERD